jgi:hypothetical protein
LYICNVINQSRKKMNRIKKEVMAFGRYLWYGSRKHLTKPVDMFITEEDAIKAEIIKILTKKGTQVKMAPRSNKFFIINDLIKVKMMINGDAEFIKMSNHDWKYGWKFRSDFINEVIELAIDWIELDRAKEEKESFENEIELIKKIGGIIDTLDTLDDSTPQPNNIGGEYVIG